MDYKQCHYFHKNAIENLCCLYESEKLTVSGQSSTSAGLPQSEPNVLYGLFEKKKLLCIFLLAVTGSRVSGSAK
jgi:hypothetical protein